MATDFRAQNFARDPEVAAAVKRLFSGPATEARTESKGSRLDTIRRDRLTMHERWLRYHAIWNAERDRQSYEGRSKSYLAIGRKIIESWVGKLKQQLFQADPWFEVQAVREVFEPRASAVRALLDYFSRTQMQIRRHAGPMLRQLVTYGTAPCHISWKVDEERLPVLREIVENGISRRSTKMEDVIRYIGPTYRNVDLFAWYVWPTTVCDVTDAEIVFEDQLTTLTRLTELSQSPCVVGSPESGMLIDPERLAELKALRTFRDSGQSGTSPREKFAAEQRRLQRKGFTHRLDDAADLENTVDVSLVYYRADLDDTGTTWWELVLACDAYPLRIRKNPWWHGRPPWLAPKFVEIVDEFYGYGLPGTFDRLQYWLTDIMDQTADGLTFSMNPIAVIDAFKVQDPSSIRMRSGAKWMADPTGVQFMEPPKETPAIGISALTSGIRMMNDVANLSPSAPSSKNRSDTATGAQILLSEALVELHDVLESLEDQWGNPMLRMQHQLTMQCMQDRNLILRVAGAEGAPLVERKISAIDVIGDFEFRWLGSLYTMNQQVRSQQEINFLQVLAGIPPEVWQSQNAEPDFKFLLRNIWSDMGLRNAQRVVKDKVQALSMDPRIENDLAKVGRGLEIRLSPSDNDEQHAQVHVTAMRDPKFPEEFKQDLFLHVQAHIAAHMAKQALQQQQEALRAQGMGMGMGAPPPMGAPNGGPHGNAMLGPTAAGAGPKNPGRLAQTAEPADVLRSAPRGMT